MQSPKQAAQALIADLPEDASFEDIRYHLYVQQLVHDRLDAVDRGEVVSHEEVKRQLKAWRER